MDISNKIPSIHRTIKGPSPQAKEKTTRPSQPVPQGDRVVLSEQAREMQAARQTIRQIPEVDLEKVAKIKAQLKEGRYQVDARKTAAKMMVESLLDGQEK